MPAKDKNTPRSKAAKPQRGAAMPAPPADVDLCAGENAQFTQREPVVAISRAEASDTLGVDAMERAIAKEDAKIIAKASARAIRRGLH